MINSSSSSTLLSSIMSSLQLNNFPGIQAQLSVTPHYLPFMTLLIILSAVLNCAKVLCQPTQESGVNTYRQLSTRQKRHAIQTAVVLRYKSPPELCK